LRQCFALSFYRKREARWRCSPKFRKRLASRELRRAIKIEAQNDLRKK